VQRVAACLFITALALVACSTDEGLEPSPTPTATIGTADVGGYSLAFECRGSGSPTVLLEAGYTASGVDTYGPLILPVVSKTTRVCTYDRAGDGASDPRAASVSPLTVTTQARELHALLEAIDVHPPYVLVGHSYGGMVARAFAAAYPQEALGMVLIDSSSEPEIPVYDRLHAGAWIDGTVEPAPNQRIDIHASVDELERAPSLGSMPLVVITAGILQDRWLATVPELEARAQTRLAGLSTDSIHVVDEGQGHMIPSDDPRVVVDAIDAVVTAARTSAALKPCSSVFADAPSVECLADGELGRQQT